MNNPSLRKSISLLTSPLSVTAILLLLINDHFLRVYAPSWITGKIGDFAWLFFSPLALAAIIAVLLPRRFKGNTHLTILLSMGMISGIFLLVNTSLLVNSWCVEWLSLVLGRPVSMVRDPTDLIALIAAGGSYLIWINSKPPEKVSFGRGLALLSLSAVLTIANAAEPDYGITCLEVDQGRLIAGNNWYQYYESWDGGLSWEEISVEVDYRCDPYSREEIEIALPDQDQILFRSGGEGVLEESLDGGKTWAAVPGIQHFTQAEVAWLEQIRSVFYQPGPLAAVSDPGSGNLVFAMGLEGVLVRSGGGEWIVVAVGDYKLVSLTLDRIPGLLKYEIFLAAAYALLLLITAGIFSGTSIFQKIWLGVVWAVWLMTSLIFQPALRTGYDLIFVSAAVIFMGISVLILLTLYLIRVWEQFKTGWAQPAARALAGFVAVIIPYLLWALNVIPDYLGSCLLSLILGSVLLAVSMNWHRGGDRGD